MYDEVGMLQDAFTFRIVNNTTTTTAYTLKLVDITTGDKLDTSLVKYGLTKNGVSSIATLSTLTDGVLDSGTIGTGSIEYELRLWIDFSVTDDTLISGKSLSYKLEIIMEQEGVEDTSCPVIAETEPNTPELTSGMIAVTYNETNKTWVKADTSTNDWYDYSNQIWANAVTVTEDTRDTYMALDVGEPISMDDINTMWVWIPRYSYTIKQRYGHGKELSCSTLTSTSEATTPVCIEATEYTEEMRESAMFAIQAVGIYNGASINDLQDESSALEFIKTMDPSIETYEDAIDFFAINGMLFGNGFYTNTGVRTEILEAYSNVNMGSTETDVVASIQANQTNIITFEHAMFLSILIGIYTPNSQYVITTADFELLEENTYDAATQELPGAIDVKFITTGEKHAGTGKCETCTENWVTPEGFTFGTENIPGFWMAKFETSTLETCSVDYYSVNTACDLLTLTPQVKPNVTSWRGARVSTFFEASRLMQSADDNLAYNADTYGFDTVGNGTMDVHMLKNIEWGIVAMLSQSKYGKYGNPNYTEANKEVYQNKSSSYITGMSNGTPGTSTYADSQVAYDTPDTGYGASTTGTIYGVYDMSGGSWEYVMGNYNNYSGYSSEENSGFSGLNSYDSSTTDGITWPNSKYYDLYNSVDVLTAYKVGDATYETLNWYSDDLKFVSSDKPWFIRGGSNCRFDVHGIFEFNMANGDWLNGYTSRLAIKP